MEKSRIGVLGGYRGTSMINYCKRADNTEVATICDKSRDALDTRRKAAYTAQFSTVAFRRKSLIFATRQSVKNGETIRHAQTQR